MKNCEFTGYFIGFRIINQQKTSLEVAPDTNKELKMNKLFSSIRQKTMEIFDSHKNRLMNGGSPSDADMSEAEVLYQMLTSQEFKESPYEQNNLGEGMTEVSQVIWGYWKPRFVMDNNAKCAYEFMSIYEELQIVTDEDIDWDSLKGLPQDALDRAKAHSFHFPGCIDRYENGIAEVRWQLNPDGMYYRDEDGFGMTNDKEINIYGAVDRKGKVVKKFSYKPR